MGTTRNSVPPKPGAPATKPAVPAAKAPVIVKAATAAKAAAPALAGAPPPVAGAMKSESLVIAFVDLGRFQIAARRVKDDVLVELLEEYYERIADGIKPAGGRVVKFMGDGALLVFPAERVNQAVRTLVMLKSDVDARLAKKKFESPFVVRVHVGEAMAGSFGPKTDKRYDVIGHAVNRTAALRTAEELALTADAYARLDARTQKLFKAKGDYFVPG